MGSWPIYLKKASFWVPFFFFFYRLGEIFFRYKWRGSNGGKEKEKGKKPIEKQSVEMGGLFVERYLYSTKAQIL